MNIRLNGKVKKNTIREQIQCVDIGYSIKKLKFKYARQMTRASNDRWKKLVTERRPYESKRKKGRPKTR